MFGKTPPNKIGRRYILNSVFSIALILFSTTSVILANKQTAFAANLNENRQEQENRTKARALIRCFEKRHFTFSDGQLVMKENGVVGHDLGSNDNGWLPCNDLLDQFLPTLGATKGGRDGRVELYNEYFNADTNHRNEVVDKWEERLWGYSNARLPLTNSEELRRIRTAVLTCADATAETIPKGQEHKYFEIDGDKFKYKNNDNDWVALGHDWWDDDGDGGQECKTVVKAAQNMQAFSDNADKELLKAECISEGAADVEACVASKVANETNPDGGGGGETAIECNMISWNALKWFLCPLIKIGETAVNALDNLITYMLKFPTDKYFTDNGSLQKAWGNMRNLALGILIIAGLVMVISQAIGTGPFDAYTIKKVMPRIVFAVIFISLSFEILKFLVEFSNIAGLGVRSLIEGAFNLSGSGQVSFSNGALAIGNGAIVGVGLSLGFMGILSLMATALLGVLLAFLVLAARQMVIIMLVIVAPIAIACYILPNTEKVWKMWWDFFIRAIFAFPIITAFIASGRAFAQVSTQGPPGDAFTNTLTSILAFIAYFGPYFALPYAFKLAGGAVAQIGGVVNDRSRGAFDRMKNYRGRKMKENSEAMKHGNRFEGRTWIPGSRSAARAFNRTSAGASTGFKGGFGLPTNRGRAAYDQQVRTGAGELTKTAGWQAIQHNDDALHAATYGSAAEARAALAARWGDDARAANAVAATQASIGFGRPQAIASAQQLVTTGTGYGNMREMVETLGRASGGNTNTAASLAGFANSATKQVGRNDLAPGFGALNGLVQNQAAGTLPTDAQYEAATQQAWGSGSIQQMLSGKPQAMQAFSDHMLDRLQNGNQVEKRHAAIALMEMQSNLPAATADNQVIINRTMHRLRNEAGTRLGIDFNAAGSTAEQIVQVATHAVNGAPAIDYNGTALTAETLVGQARVYGGEPQAMRNQPTGGGVPPAATGGGTT